MRKSVKSICIDFDGVIHGYTSGWKGAGCAPDAPVPGAIDAIREYMKEFNVIILSTRAETEIGRETIAEYLMQHGLTVLEMAQIKIHGHGHKPIATIYIDDRGFHFKGEFPSLEFVKNFKP